MLNLNIFKSPNVTHSLQEIQERGEQVEHIQDMGALYIKTSPVFIN